ncbi:hypothetical protein [Azospirillum palustre]
MIPSSTEPPPHSQEGALHQHRPPLPAAAPVPLRRQARLCRHEGPAAPPAANGNRNKGRPPGAFATRRLSRDLMAAAPYDSLPRAPKFELPRPAALQHTADAQTAHHERRAVDEPGIGGYDRRSHSHPLQRRRNRRLSPVAHRKHLQTWHGRVVDIVQGTPNRHPDLRVPVAHSTRCDTGHTEHRRSCGEIGGSVLSPAPSLRKRGVLPGRQG